MTLAKQKLNWFNVTMAWGQSDVGTYSGAFLASDEETAKRQCAEEMADSGEVGFDDSSDRDQFIESTMQGYADVYRTSDQFRQDFEKLFGFSVDMDRLGKLVQARRDELVGKPAADLVVNVTDVQVAADDEPREFFLTINHEQSAGNYTTLKDARVEGQRMCDADPIPSVWTITGAEGNLIETIQRTDGASLSDQVAVFNKLHLK